MGRAFPCIFIGVGLAAFVVAVGFFLDQGWATGLIPWPAKHLSNVFISSIFAAIGAPILWMGISREWAAVFGGAFNLGVASFGIAWFSIARGMALNFGISMAVFFAVCVVQVFATRKIEFQDKRPIPMPVRVSFGIFGVLLITLGLVLVNHRSNVFPWQLTEAQQALYGWIFLGAACYFLYALRVPYWGNAQGQLAGFLAYDIVLIVPYLQHFAKVPDSLRPNLIVYVCVLVYSGGLAAYYLFFDRKLRLGTRAT